MACYDVRYGRSTMSACPRRRLSSLTGVTVFGDRVAREHLLGLGLVVAGIVLVHGGG